MIIFKKETARCTGVFSGSNHSDEQIKKISLTPNPKYFTKELYFILGRKAHPYISPRASFTIEAALILPLFLFLMLSVLYLFEVALLQMQIRDALYDTALLKARTAYLTDDEDADDEETASVFASLLQSGIRTAVSSFSIQSGIDDDLGALIVGGVSGIVCTEDEDAASDSITALQAECIVKLPVSVFGSFRFLISEQVSVRNWNGYDPTDSAASDMVYVTVNGTVYHEDRNCSYLNPSVKTVTAEQLSTRRNSSGHIYYACEYCGDAETSAGLYYITTYGETYHTSLTCSGLKRTVYLVSRDETDLPACSKCGGSGD